MSCLGDMGSATEPAGALSNVGQEARPAPRESFTRREPVLTPHLLFLCEVEAESPAPTLTAPACVVSGASCRLAVYQQGCWASLVHRFPLVTLSPGVLGSDPPAACPAVWEMLRTSRSCCRETGNSTARAGGGGGFQWVPDDWQGGLCPAGAAGLVITAQLPTRGRAPGLLPACLRDRHITALPHTCK